MTMEAFIRKNTNEIRKKLESMGYTFIPNGRNEWNIPINDLPYLCTGIERNYAGTGKDFAFYMGTNGYWYDSWVDCGDDV